MRRPDRRGATPGGRRSNLKARWLGRAGSAALEFALLAPLVVVLMVAVAEVVTYLRAWHRLERTAAEVANIASQYQTLVPADVATLFDAASTIATPWKAWSTTGPATGRARTVIGVVNGTGGGNTLAWSCSRGDTALPNRIAGVTALPNNFLVPAGQTVLVVEVISGTRAWSLMSATGFGFFGTAGPDAIRTYAIVRPRQAQLNALGGACPA